MFDKIRLLLMITEICSVLMIRSFSNTGRFSIALGDIDVI
jgi:hypothetical protein